MAGDLELAMQLADFAAGLPAGAMVLLGIQATGRSLETATAT